LAVCEDVWFGRLVENLHHNPGRWAQWKVWSVDYEKVFGRGPERRVKLQTPDLGEHAIANELADEFAIRDHRLLIGTAPDQAPFEVASAPT
jgi:hypothetical protein